MAVYNVSGTELSDVYDNQSSVLIQAYDINGNPLIDSGGGDDDHQDWSGMTAQFQGTVNDCLNYIETYINNNQDSFAFPVFTDVHLYFDGNEPNYVAYHKPSLFPVFLMLGDMTNLYDATQLSNAVTYMSYATDQNKLVSLGNHEWGNYDTESQDDYPREWYKTLLPPACVIYPDDGLTYYYDDDTNNIRYIMLDSNSTVKKQSGVQKFDMAALDWMASILESSGDKDVIIMNHAIGSSFYLVTDTEKTDPKSDTTITNSTTFNSVVNAYINKSSVYITVDGVQNFHDFSFVEGKIIGYFTGHYHNAGYTDASGFNKFTCPAIIRNNLTNKGMSFFIVDKTLQKIIWLIARYQNAQYELYEYTY